MSAVSRAFIRWVCGHIPYSVLPREVWTGLQTCSRCLLIKSPVIMSSTLSKSVKKACKPAFNKQDVSVGRLLEKPLPTGVFVVYQWSLILDTPSPNVVLSILNIVKHGVQVWLCPPVRGMVTEESTEGRSLVVSRACDRLASLRTVNKF